ncbi:hypothetical protein Trydic_g18346 [Trypoxylus dichotomus]
MTDDSSSQEILKRKSLSAVAEYNLKTSHTKFKETSVITKYPNFMEGWISSIRDMEAAFTRPHPLESTNQALPRGLYKHGTPLGMSEGFRLWRG